MEERKEKENGNGEIICLFDKNQEDLDKKIIKIFESYLERNSQKNT